MTEPRTRQRGVGFAGLADLVSDGTQELGRLALIPDPPPAAGTPGRRGVGTSAMSANGRPGLRLGIGAKVVLGAGAACLLFYLGFSDSAEPGQARTAPGGAATTRTPAASAWIEALPPVGVGHILTTEQLRYCLAEDVRLESMRETIVTDDDGLVSRFNASVADYNSRCAEARYRSPQMAVVQSQLKDRRSILIQEGRSRAIR